MLDHKDQELPVRGYLFGMALFLATLTMLFGASMIGYVIVRLRMADPDMVTAPLTVMPLGMLRPPNLLFLSTAMILASSVTVHYAVDALRKGRADAFRRGLVLTLLLSAGFVLVQAPALVGLLGSHRAQAEGRMFLYGLVFFLILVHALHVLGGLVALVTVTVRAQRGAYGDGHDGPVRCLAYYWHFLDAVWIVMFSLFMALG